MYDLKRPEISYMIGFLQTDGHHSATTRNRGKVTLKIGSIDEGILYKMSSFLDVNYSITRRTVINDFTNGKEVEHATLCICNLNFRKWLSDFVPIGKKSEIIKPPSIDYSEIDYWRGVIDGDGSLGITGKGFPFIGLVTASENLAKAYLCFIEKITGEVKHINRNKRDNIYNIMSNRENAQKLISKIYYKNCLALERKQKKAFEALKWKRPKNMKKINKKNWDKKEDNYILSHSIKESMRKLNRSNNSVKMRLFRLKKSSK